MPSASTIDLELDVPVVVHETEVWNRLGASSIIVRLGLVVSDEVRRLVDIPVAHGQQQLAPGDLISVGRVAIPDDQWTSEPISNLASDVRMPPVSSDLGDLPIV
jgi:hypothetical protein